MNRCPLFSKYLFSSSLDCRRLRARVVRVHGLNDAGVHLGDNGALELEGGAQLAASNAEIDGQNLKLLDLLRVGHSLDVAALDALQVIMHSCWKHVIHRWIISERTHDLHQ